MSPGDPNLVGRLVKFDKKLFHLRTELMFFLNNSSFDSVINHLSSVVLLK